jgi:hypothetical protein
LPDYRFIQSTVTTVQPYLWLTRVSVFVNGSHSLLNL